MEMQFVPPRLPRLGPLMSTPPSSSAADFDPVPWCVRDNSASTSGPQVHASAQPGQNNVRGSSVDRELGNEQRKISATSEPGYEPADEAHSWFSEERRTQDVGVGTSHDQSTIGSFLIKCILRKTVQITLKVNCSLFRLRG